ncbi:MAG TPA: heme ABC exporter ATP-binding protein CcmA [Gemmatimonadales bacterium]|nr:heme ABC exporter ATP-binding protein CcmA [Gemmatimonadales bacterium]
MPLTNPPRLAATGLERRFGASRAVRGITLELAPGELLLVLGPNGAGKTTLLRMLAGLARPSRGAVTVDGRPLLKDPATRRSVGLISHQTLLYDDLTARENLRFTAGLYGLPNGERVALDALERVRLSGRADEPLRRLSRGMVQRVAIARALLHTPTVLLLDEPFTGLDTPSVGRIREVICEQRAAGSATVLVTHNPAEAWDLATHVGVMVQGLWAIYEPRADGLEGFLERYAEAVRG